MSAAWTRAARYTSWRYIVGTYVIVSLVGHLAWELLQLPLYTIFWTEPPGYIAYATAHCTAGDMLTALFTFFFAIVVMNRTKRLTERTYIRVALLTIFLGFAYTLFSEWLNVSIRESWTYTSAMPRLPVLGTGLAPLLQWLVIPTLALSSAWRRARRMERNQPT